MKRERLEKERRSERVCLLVCLGVQMCAWTVGSIETWPLLLPLVLQTFLGAVTTHIDTRDRRMTVLIAHAIYTYCIAISTPPCFFCLTPLRTVSSSSAA